MKTAKRIARAAFAFAFGVLVAPPLPPRRETATWVRRRSRRANDD